MLPAVQLVCAVNIPSCLPNADAPACSLLQMPMPQLQKDSWPPVHAFASPTVTRQPERTCWHTDWSRLWQSHVVAPPSCSRRHASGAATQHPHMRPALACAQKALLQRIAVGQEYVGHCTPQSQTGRSCRMWRTMDTASGSLGENA